MGIGDRLPPSGLVAAGDQRQPQPQPQRQQPQSQSPRRVSVLGATGSIGQTTLELMASQPEAFEVVAVTAHRQVFKLAALARAFGVRYAAIGEESLLPELRGLLAGSGIACGGGAAAMSEAAAYPSDLVMAAMVGASGLLPTLTAIRRGAMVGFANKEVLVCAGALVMAEAKRCNGTLLPVDSEHNANFQLLQNNSAAALDKIILTASGGPFRDWSIAEMAVASREQAVRHPVWSMGAKISIDSATMMNKGLEIIEAHHLFAIPRLRSRWWFIRSRWFIRWWPIAMVRCWRSLGLRICAPRLPMPSPGRSGWRPAGRGWIWRGWDSWISRRPTRYDSRPCGWRERR